MNLRWRIAARSVALLPVAVLCLAAGDADPLPPVSAPRPAVEDLAPSGPSVEQRLAEIQRRVQSAMRYPAISRDRGVAGETWVVFEIGADGLATGLKTVKSSGHGALDRAALSAVERAGPLPWVYGRVTVPVQFSLRDGD